MAPRHLRRNYSSTSSTSTTSSSVSFLPVIITSSSSSSSSTSSVHGTMKWQQRRPTEVRPFLVLPLLDSSERSVSADGLPTVKKNISPGGRTGTWPPKLKIKPIDAEEHPSKIERPLTATLERPELLNINLLDKIDMSQVRKEFLCITNIGKDTVTVAIVAAKGRTKLRAALKAPAISVTPNSEPNKRSRKPETSEDSLESDENNSVRRRRKMSKINKLSNRPIKGRRSPNDTNNNTAAILESASKSPTTIPTPTTQNRLRRRLKPPSTTVATQSPKSDVVSDALPEPCTTCGRPDQPERFHSHPATPLVRHTPRDSPRKQPQAKSTVQKPVAIKYKSQPREKSPQKKIGEVKQVKEQVKQVKVMLAVEAKNDGSGKSPARGPRTVICYICGREFGTASLPLHEPKCLQKWERENCQLPRHLQRPVPVKPDKPMTPEEWNKFAWEASQAALAACFNCGRTFLPERLLVHQRSCKTKVNGPQNALHQQRIATHSVTSKSPPGDLVLSSVSSTPSHGTRDGSMPSSPPGGPPTVECYICGRMFGTKSIGIHEPQCLRKWHLQNNLLPTGQRMPPPTKKERNSLAGAPETKQLLSGGAVVPITSTSPSSTPNRPPSGPKKPMLPCYICGREYGTSSIYIHEPQCLKKWRIENEKLAPSQRRKEPERPDIKFTPSGQIDYEATNDVLWQSHLSQLVPCQMCGRTFNPDRVVVHQRSCKGQ